MYTSLDLPIKLRVDYDVNLYVDVQNTWQYRNTSDSCLVSLIEK